MKIFNRAPCLPTKKEEGMTVNQSRHEIPNGTSSFDNFLVSDEVLMAESIEAIRGKRLALTAAWNPLSVVVSFVEKLSAFVG
jgi:hypothetical protein